MKFLHTAFLLLFVANLVHSQTLDVMPAAGNPVLRSFAAQKTAQDAALVEQMTGHEIPPNQIAGERANDCPPDLEGNFLTSGDSLVIILDTFGLMKDTFPATLTIENESSLLYGTIVFGADELYLAYYSMPGLAGAQTETILFKLSQPGHDTIVPIEIHVRRKSRVVITQSQTVQAESITTFCLSSELDFTKPKNCSRAFNCPDNYDGIGQTIFHLSSYDYPDTCLVYYASRFPGVDTVCMRICDDWGVCDTFKVPYIIPGDTLSIATNPFFDDFSSYKGPYPSRDYWVDKDVYLNYTLAKDPPSVGFVTFDGIDRRGNDYDLVSGVGDRLTSKAIDLSNYNASSDIFLRFFLSPKGYGLEPDITDVMKLEFRNSNREWVTAGTFDGTGNVPLDSVPPFTFYAVKVDDPQFFHKGFQFRFSANTSPGGSVDLWHLDYVHLSKDADGSDDFQDLAFTELPTSILKNYTAMPWNQFKGHVSDETTNLLESNFYNHYTEVLAISASNIKYKELTTNTTVNSPLPVIEGGSDSNIDPKIPTSRSRTIPSGDLSSIVTNLNNIPPGNLRILETEYTIRPSAQLADFAVNDTVRLQTNFSNYFAHDDGTAEWQIFVNHAGGSERLATKFHANVMDSMKAVQIMFPHVNGDVQDQFFNLEIYVGSLDSDPVFVRSLLSPYYPNNRYDTLQGFTTYVLDNELGQKTPVGIPADSVFYVSFQQASATLLGIPIGFDIQNPCNCNYLNLNDDTWSSFSSNLKGSLMIRPVFGTANNTNSAAHEITGTDKFPMNIYPNPTTGFVNFALDNGKYEDFQLAVFNNLGQLVSQGKLTQRLDISSLNNGVYQLRFLNEKTGEVFSERIILAKE